MVCDVRRRWLRAAVTLPSLDEAYHCGGEANDLPEEVTLIDAALPHIVSEAHCVWTVVDERVLQVTLFKEEEGEPIVYTKIVALRTFSLRRVSTF